MADFAVVIYPVLQSVTVTFRTLQAKDPAVIQQTQEIDAFIYCITSSAGIKPCRDKTCLSLYLDLYFIGQKRRGDYRAMSFTSISRTLADHGLKRIWKGMTDESRESIYTTVESLCLRLVSLIEVVKAERDSDNLASEKDVLHLQPAQLANSRPRNFVSEVLNTYQ